jgi:hypothetical protein
VAYCRACDHEWPEDVSECPVCGAELTERDESDSTTWIALGSFEDQLTADFARETLKSKQIPAVLISRMGFFGNAGLQMTSFYGSTSPGYEIRVPESFAEEAAEILDAVLGDKWKRITDEE